jgi:hypothetical protein
MTSEGMRKLRTCAPATDSSSNGSTGCKNSGGDTKAGRRHSLVQLAQSGCDAACRPRVQQEMVSVPHLVDVIRLDAANCCACCVNQGLHTRKLALHLTCTMDGRNRSWCQSQYE